jgi:hypothetical protein
MEKFVGLVMEAAKISYRGHSDMNRYGPGVKVKYKAR